MSNPAFLNNVIDFGKFGKDKINEETIEFLVPYLEIEGFNPQARPYLFLRPLESFNLPAFELNSTYPFYELCCRYPWPKTLVSPFARPQWLITDILLEIYRSKYHCVSFTPNIRELFILLQWLGVVKIRLPRMRRPLRRACVPG